MNNMTPVSNGNRPAGGGIKPGIAAIAERDVGAVIGSAAGDALGAGYEGSYPGRFEEIVIRGGRGYYPSRKYTLPTNDTPR